MTIKDNRISSVKSKRCKQCAAEISSVFSAGKEDKEMMVKYSQAGLCVAGILLCVCGAACS